MSRLNEDGSIRRIAQGVYDKPEYSEFLQEYSAPRIDKVAEAYARKYNWTISASGNSALNLLNVSTQVPNVWLYISDGVNREYQIGNTKLIKKKKANKEITGYSRITRLVVQGIKALGKDNISKDKIELFSNKLSKEDKKIILEEGKASTAWVYKAIRQICEKEG